LVATEREVSVATGDLVAAESWNSIATSYLQIGIVPIVAWYGIGLDDDATRLLHD
jgi:hypothetical protein